MEELIGNMLLIQAGFDGHPGNLKCLKNVHFYMSIVD